jgi:hypothetical protein
MLPPSDSITVVVTAVAHTVPLAHGISEAEYEREGGDPMSNSTQNNASEPRTVSY